MQYFAPLFQVIDPSPPKGGISLDEGKPENPGKLGFVVPNVDGYLPNGDIPLPANNILSFLLSLSLSSTTIF